MPTDFAKYLHPTYGELQTPIDQFPLRPTGVLLGKRFSDWVYGKVSGIKYEAVLASADWRPFIVLGETQGQPYFPFETFACTDYSNNSLAEIQLKQQTGYEFNFSDRALSVLSGTTNSGNYLYKVADVGVLTGRIMEADYPDDKDDPQTWAQYNRPLPPLIFHRFNEAYEWVDTDKASLQYHLKQAPLQITIPGNNPNHAVVLLFIDSLGYWYFDSYAPFLKVMSSPPASALKIIVKPMSNAVFYHKVGTQEYGFALPKLSPDALRDMALNLGKNELIKADGTLDFAQAKEISGL